MTEISGSVGKSSNKIKAQVNLSAFNHLVSTFSDSRYGLDKHLYKHMVVVTSLSIEEQSKI